MSRTTKPTAFEQDDGLLCRQGCPPTCQAKEHGSSQPNNASITRTWYYGEMVIPNSHALLAQGNSTDSDTPA